MAIIPNGQQFNTVSAHKVLKETGSAFSNDKSHVYTMQDVIDTALSGTNTVHVKANGTPKENGVALLKGYEEAKTKVGLIETTYQHNMAGTVWLGTDQGLPYGVWGMQRFFPFFDFVVIPNGGDSYTGTVIIESAGQQIPVVLTAVVEAGGNGIPAPSANGWSVRFYYQDGTEFVGTTSNSSSPLVPISFMGGQGALLVPTSVQQSANLVIEPGIYNIDQDWVLDGQYVNVTSSTGQPDVIIQGGNIDIQAGYFTNSKYTYINGLSTIIDTSLSSTETSGIGDFSIFIADSLSKLTVSNCESRGQFSFSIKPGETGSISSEFYNCHAKYKSFGYGVGNQDMGYYVNCESAAYGFGAFTNSEKGRYINCFATTGFGYSSLDVQGKHWYCRAGNDSFGADATNISANAEFLWCQGGNDSFGTGATSDNCTSYKFCAGGSDCFRGGLPTTTGENPKYYNCTGTNLSFRNIGTGTISEKNMYNCNIDTGTGTPTVGDGALVWNSSAYNWAVSGTGKITNCLKEIDWTSVTLP
jgi:hypothetical protein